MALVVMRHGAASPLLHRQARLRPIQRLDLRLFIHAQHHRLVRGVEEDAHHIRQLLHEPLVLRQLERFDSVRLQAVRLSDPRHVAWLTPWACARVRVLQWVASGGVVGRVASSMARTFRGDRRWALGPCGASSDRPDGPAPLNRFRHSSTVGREVSKRGAIALVASPSAASRQIRDRSTTLWGLVFARLHASNVCFCSPVIGKDRKSTRLNSSHRH